MILSIDPDLRKSGVCILDAMGRISSLDSLTIVQLLQLVDDLPSDTIYAIEDVTKNKKVYGRNLKEYEKVAKAQSVGMVKAAGTLIAELIESKTGKPIILAPTGLGKQFKNDSALFKEITGYSRQTNEDKRDAYAIANWVFKNRERLAK